MIEKINLGEHVVTWKGFLAVIVPICLALMLVERDAINDLDKKVESRVSREEFLQHVANQNRWQDRVNAQLDAISKVSAVETHDIAQAQYVLVQLPPGPAELREETIRQILTKGE